MSLWHSCTWLTLLFLVFSKDVVIWAIYASGLHSKRNNTTVVLPIPHPLLARRQATQGGKRLVGVRDLIPCRPHLPGTASGRHPAYPRRDSFHFRYNRVHDDLVIGQNLLDYLVRTFRTEWTDITGMPGQLRWNMHGS